MTKKVTGGLRHMHDKNFIICTLHKLLVLIKPWGMRWEQHTAWKKVTNLETKFQSKNPKRKYY